MLKIAHIAIIIILIAVILAGCTGIMSTPTPTPTVTPAAADAGMLPNQTITTNIGKTTPTAQPDVLVHGIITLDGKPVEKYQVTVAFPISMGWARVMAETGSDGSYAIHMDSKQLRNMTFSMPRVSDNYGNTIYSDGSTYRIDGQPLNFAFVTQSGSPSIMPPSAQISSRITPTPTVDPIRTAKAPVKTTYMASYVEFKVYEDKVVVEYLSGQGKIFVNAFNMGGEYGETSGYLREPGNNITLRFNLSMPRELPEQDAFIEAYQPTESGVVVGGAKYYPRTGDMKEI